MKFVPTLSQKINIAIRPKLKHFREVSGWVWYRNDFVTDFTHPIINTQREKLYGYKF